MRMTISLCFAVAFVTLAARAEDKPNALERGVTKAGKAVERTGDRAAKGTAHGVNSAGNWTGRHVERAGKSVGHTVDKTENWVKKKTQ